MSARDGIITYEVRLEADESLAAEIDAWLPEHVAEMLRFRGFTSAEIHEDEPLPISMDGKIRRTVQYQLENRDALAAYLREHSARMREAGIKKFGDRVSITRRVLQAMGEVPLTASTRECSNCHAPLNGQYCALCGQRDRSRMISLWELLTDLVGEVFDLDSRLWRTLFPLLFRPGRLTHEYLLGRRVAFTPPLRLYVISSVVFFLIATYGGVESGFQFDDDSEQPSSSTVTEGSQESDESAQSAQPASPSDAEKPSPSGPPAKADDSTDDDDGWMIGDDGHCTFGDFETGNAFVDGPLHARLLTACNRIAADHGKNFLRQLINNIPKMLFFFLPAVAFVMKPLYFGSRRYYVEHLLFFVHLHSFVFIVLSLTVLTSRLSAMFPGWEVANGLTIAAVTIYIPYYLFRALRVVYGQGRFVTLLKYIVLFFTYLFGLSFIFFVGAVFTALTV